MSVASPRKAWSKQPSMVSFLHGLCSVSMMGHPSSREHCQEAGLQDAPVVQHLYVCGLGDAQAILDVGSGRAHEKKS